MSKIFTPIICFFFIFLAFDCQAQKAESARYHGGHGCIASSLILYSDSTFKFKVSTALPIPHRTSLMTRKYSLNDSTITLNMRKRLYFLIFSYNSKNKFKVETFRIRDNNILMYSEKDELSENSEMIKDYNTMWFHDYSK